MPNCPHLDEVLGLNEPISRRDFLNGSLMASAGMLAASACPFPLAAQMNSAVGSSWTGYSGEGDYKTSAGNTERVIQSVRLVRDGKYDGVPSDVTETGEVYDCGRSWRRIRWSVRRFVLPPKVGFQPHMLDSRQCTDLRRGRQAQ
jgi:hypothetical protein